MSKILNKNKGFTLLEIILVVALLTIISTIISPIYFSAKGSNDLSNSANAVVSSLRKAQLLSMAVKEDSSWGVKLNDDEIIIFKGDDYLSRDFSRDEIFKINKSINITSLDEIVFLKFSGRPNLFGDIFLANNGKNKILNINSLGVIEY